MIKTAMILAAGRGERLRPITDTLPKALCAVHGVPLIEYHIANLAKAGFERLVINHAHLGGQIRHQVGNGSRWGVEIFFTPEPTGGLETGGGIFNALPLLGNEPFVTVNADIYTDYNFATLKLPTHSLLHLVLVNKPPQVAQGDFGLSPNHFLDNNNREYTCSGIACYRPEVFSGSKPGRYSVVPLWRALADQKQATGELHLGRWIDIGSPEQFRLANGRDH